MPTKEFSVDVVENSSVVDLRKAVAEKVQKEPAQLVLIFGGKILKNEDTLETHSIQNGHSVHLVIKNQRQEPKTETRAEAAPAASPAAPTPASNPTPSNPFEALAGLGGGLGGGLGAGLGGGMNDQVRNLMNNPEAMNQLMDSPIMQNMMQSLMDNPQLLQEMIRANPQMNQVMENNPELAHIFNNPALIRQAMEMHRNPSMMQEMMRNQDRAMSNIENLPGGMQALERMYRDIQEPMMNATAGRNQYQSSNNDNQTTTNNQAGRQNTDALPNPWGGNRTNTTNSSGGNTQTNPTAAGNSGPLGGLNSGMLQQTMEMMRSNPELMRQMMQTMNPQLANNPQMQRFLETYMTSPEMTNPAVIQAMEQISRGYETLRREAPRLWESFGIDGNIQQMMTQMGNTGLGGATGGPVGGGVQTPADAETRWAEQLSQLEMMGFSDKAANIQALTHTAGNVEAAVDRLLSRR